jgi:hypothetical protein
MKELPHIRRARERWAARRARRAAWWAGQEPVDNYGMRVWVDWARRRVAARPAAPDEQQPGESTEGYIQRSLREWRQELGLV